MPYYLMDEWEHSGRDDSDWYAVVYCSEEDTLQRYEIGSTRYANALPCNPPRIHRQIDGEWTEFVLEKPSEEILVKARACLVRDYLIGMIQKSEQDKIFRLKPERVGAGKKVVFTEDHKNQVKTCQTKPCEKCQGGYWINPRNSEDKRPCFTCKGAGVIKFDFQKAKVNDKVVWKKIALGTKAEIVSLRSYGKFYKSGYNQPNEHNTTALVRLEDGSEAFVPLSKLRLAEEMPTEEKIKKKAEAIASQGGAFYIPFATASMRF